jgi:hypothetical protein
MGLGAGDGTLQMTVWPSYIGFCVEDPGAGPIPYGEPQEPYYQRGQITWTATENDIVGRAVVAAPKTTTLFPYTHLAFFSGPEGNCMVGKSQLAQPIVFASDGVIEVYPITNPDLRCNQRQGIDY